MKMTNINAVMFTTLLTLTINAHAGEIKTYSELLTKLKQGTSIVIVTHFAKCYPTDNGIHHSTAIGYATPNNIMIVAEEKHVVTSILHFSNQSGKPVYEYVKYHFYPEQKASVEFYTLDPQTFVAIKPKVSYTCDLNKSISVFEN